MKKILLILFIICLTQLFAQNNTNLDFAKKLFNDKLYDEALNELNNTIAQTQNAQIIDEANFLIAEIYLNKKQYNVAENAYLDLINKSLTVTTSIKEKAYAQLGLINYNQQKYDKSAEYFKKLISLYSSSESAKKNIFFYLDSYYQLNNYNEVIIQGRDLLKFYPKDPLQADIMLIMAQAYYKMQIVTEAEKTINDIKNLYPNSTARAKSIELQIDLIEQSRGKKVAIEELKKTLKSPLNRNVEEKLNLRLVEYYLKENQVSEARKITEVMIEKYNFSSNLDYYYVLWMESSIELRDFQKILTKLDFIKKLFNESAYKNRAYISVAYANFYNNDTWSASSIVNEFEPKVTEEKIKYEYLNLKAQIAEKQGKFTEALDEYNYLIQYYSYMGNNAVLYNKIADLYFEKFENPSQAVLYYSQMLSNTHDQDLKYKALFKIALCYEKQLNYQEALENYKKINTESLTADQRQQVNDKIYLLQLFYVSNTDLLLRELLKAQVNQNIDNQIKMSALYAWALKDYNYSREMLNSLNDSRARQELIKIKLMLAYKAFLEKDNKNMNDLFDQIDKDLNTLEADSEVKISAQILKSWMFNNARLNSEITIRIETYLANVNQDEYFTFNNWFRYWIWTQYKQDKQYEKMNTIALKINKDWFVSSKDYEQIKLHLAEYFYLNKDYQKAITAYKMADSWLNLSNPVYYYHYTMSRYYLGFEDEAINTLKIIILNAENIPEVNSARYLIVEKSIQKKKYDIALETLLNITPGNRTDKDFQMMSTVYNLMGNNAKEKEAIMSIQNKSLDMLRRLAVLHEATNDKIMAEYTWTELSQKETDPELKAYAYFALANLAFESPNYKTAATSYQTAFTLLNKNYETEKIPYSLPQMAKRMIICFYKLNNRPKAEATEKEYQVLLKQDSDAIMELKMNAGIYYLKMDPKKAEKTFNDIIKDKLTPNYVLDETYLWRGVYYLQTKKSTDAERDFLLAANSSNSNIKNQAMLKLGSYYFTKEVFDQAMDYYYAVITNDSTGVLALDAAHNFAMVAKINNEWEKAIKTYQMIIDKWGDKQITSETQFNIAFCYYKAKLYDRSIQILEQNFNFFASDDLKAEALYWIGENYFAKEEFDLAVNSFLRVGYSYPNVIKWAGISELRAGEAYLKNKQMDKAKSTLEKVVRVYGENSQAGSEARKILNTVFK